MEKPYIGGQAVIEGVMMRSPKSFVVAVRRPDGSIAVRDHMWESFLPGLKFLKWPLLRGAVVLLESLQNGFSALTFSAEQALPEEEKGSDSDETKTSVSTSLMLLLSTVLMIGLFIAAPHLLTYGLSRLLQVDMNTRGFLFHIVDGAFRIAILLGYIVAISRTKHAARLFQYHGAEHKAIWAYESGLPLTVANAQRFGRQHPRCGTSFLFVVVFVAILLHIALLPLLPRLHPNEFINQLLMVMIKIPMAFPIAGIAYELQRLSARKNCPRIIQLLTLPGMWLQNITTQEPEASQLEIALLALGRALAREEGRAGASDGVNVYSDYAIAIAA